MSKFPYNYDVYYVHEFPIDDLDRYHRDPEKELKKFVNTLTEHIAEFGLKNPICVLRHKGLNNVRPGKCRVSAYRTLGYDHIPAVVADFDRGPHPVSWISLPYDATFIQKQYYSGDCVVEMERRFFNVKKNVDVVHRPGVEDQFARELRLAKRN